MVALAPSALAADDTDEMQSFVLTIMCTVYGDDTDDFLGLILGLEDSDCSVSTEHSEPIVEETESTTVIISEGSLFPGCDVTNDCFDPFSVTIEPGDEVVWINEDDTIHTVTTVDSYGTPSTADSERIPPTPNGILNSFLDPGESLEFTFDSAGTYPYMCVIHPWAIGVVKVVDDNRPMKVMDDIIAEYQTRGDDIVEWINEETEDMYPDVTVFALDAEELDIVAHGTNPVYIGINARFVLDGASIPIDTLVELLRTQPEGVWISYPVPDPTDLSNILFYDRGWFKESGDYIFGVRYALSDEAFSQNVVKELVRIHKLNPSDSDTIAYVNSIMTTDTAYPFLLDPEDYTVIGHGVNPDRVGATSVALTESNKPTDVILDELRNNDGTWVEYSFNNPSTGLEQHKRSWLVLYDGIIFGSGYYIPGSSGP